MSFHCTLSIHLPLLLHIGLVINNFKKKYPVNLYCILHYSFDLADTSHAEDDKKMSSKEK